MKTATTIPSDVTGLIGQSFPDGNGGAWVVVKPVDRKRRRLCVRVASPPETALRDVFTRDSGEPAVLDWERDNNGRRRR